MLGCCAGRPRDAAPVRTFDVPAGTGRLFANAGSEVTTHEIVIATSGHVVVTVTGTAAYTASDLEAVARGIAG